MSKPAKKHARILTSHYECILNYYPQIILEIAPKPKRAEVKLEKRLRKVCMIQCNCVIAYR